MSVDNHESNIAHFTALAEKWDENPVVVAVAKQFNDLIKSHAGITLNGAEVMDFGCGSGLVAFDLAAQGASVAAVDLTPAMIDVVNNKIKAYGTTTVNSHCVELTSPDQLEGKRFDLIVTSLAFHHVNDVEKTLELLYQFLKQGGRLLIADLEHTADTPHFHPTAVHHTVVVHGFTESYLEEKMNAAGFTDVKTHRKIKLSKKCEDDLERVFDVLVWEGRR
eukprot:Colp12_sorted_trinity150504_noHs@29350